MKDILYDYQMTATTWVYLSSLIMISVYFKFRRFWSVRNLDLIGLIFLAPGLLLVAHGESLLVRTANVPAAETGARPAQRVEGGEPTSRAEQAPATSEPNETGAGRVARGRQFVQRGYLWLFLVSLFFLLRMLIDSAMVRRPLLEPNLSAGGLTFACASMLVFLMSNVITERPPTDAATAASAGEKHAAEQHAADSADGGKPTAGQSAEVQEILRQRGPGYPWFQVFASDSAGVIQRITAIVAHLSIVLGLVLIGYRHFDNTHTGIAAATLYLLLPYTAEYTPRIDHVVPGALLAWAIQCYRRPVFAGIFIGLAAGLTCYPLFLLPLWCSFYWRRGLVRFCVSVAVVLGLIIASLALMPSSLGSYWEQLLRTVGLWNLVHPSTVRGFWEPPLDPFRWPVMALFFAICVTMIFWPAQKNLGTLLACSAAIMLATQFWKALDGGTYMGWYLPLLILTILRPNLEDRVALSAISEGWVKWRK
jgi:hypothetical protein